MPALQKKLTTQTEDWDFRSVFETHAGFVWRTLRYFGVAPSDLEDVAQEVFMVVHRRLPEFEGRSTMQTWLYRICSNVAANYRTRAHRRRESPRDEMPEVGGGARQHAEVERRQARKILLDLLESIEEKKREVFILYEMEDMPMAEIAEAVGCPLQTAYSRLHAARRELDAALQRLKARGRES